MLAQQRLFYLHAYHSNWCGHDLSIHMEVRGTTYREMLDLSRMLFFSIGLIQFEANLPCSRHISSKSEICEAIQPQGDAECNLASLGMILKQTPLATLR